VLLREDVESIKIFYCYDRKDKKLKEKLGTHLEVLKKTYPIVVFFDIEEILPGENLEEEIDKLFSTSDIILALVSADFFSTNYFNVGMQKASDQK
jgi:hypothetical protein